MGTETKTQVPLRVFFFPLMSPGHMIPMIDVAKLFARHGAATTIITTPANEPFARPAIDRANSSSPPLPHPINLIFLPFPSSVHHLLPAGHENFSSITSDDDFNKLFTALFALDTPFGHLLQSHQPDCLVSDSVFTWSAAISADLNIPRLIFHGPGIFTLCIHDNLNLHDVYGQATTFTIQDIPHDIHMNRWEVPNIFTLPMWLQMLRDAEDKSYGVVVNSFYELEPDYAELYRRKPGRRAWYIGPVSLYNESADEKAVRGLAETEHEELTSWLDTKPAGSVVYVSFGSLCVFSVDQVEEIAAGLEISGHCFVWVVRDKGPSTPEGFEERVKGRGVVVRGWVPQVVLLGHVAVGGFVNHCGWNSVLEGISAGLPMVTWPLMHEQFINEKLVNEVLGIGVRARREGQDPTVVIGREEVGGAVRRLMDGGDEAEVRRGKAREYARMARTAIEDGGSSRVDLNRLMDELTQRRGGVGGEEKVEISSN
nr:putative glycosyltransferase GT3 [Dioscorea zingiberensis]